jgi:hypothetical protein
LPALSVDYASSRARICAILRNNVSQCIEKCRFRSLDALEASCGLATLAQPQCTMSELASSAARLSPLTERPDWKDSRRTLGLAERSPNNRGRQGCRCWRRPRFDRSQPGSVTEALDSSVPIAWLHKDSISSLAAAREGNGTRSSNGRERTLTLFQG